MRMRSICSTEDALWITSKPWPPLPPGMRSTAAPISDRRSRGAACPAAATAARARPGDGMRTAWAPRPCAMRDASSYVGEPAPESTSILAVPGHRPSAPSPYWSSTV